MTLRRPTTSQIREAAEDLGMELSEAEIETFAGMAQGALDAFDLLDLMPDYLPPVKYPRTPGYRPEGEENKYGAWYVKTSIKGHEGGKLAGKKIAIKDAVCVAGVPLMDGASALEGYVPDVDATVVTRILDAGGEIAGKAVCEYFSYAGTSYTPSTGVVHNPRKYGYSAGGSSSGSAALVAAGEVDMAIGVDAAGSTRIPAAVCGVYGMKQTWGLVPFSGVVTAEFNSEHVNPMSATVADNALLLEVIAGDDGMDLRSRAVPASNYTEALKESAGGLRIALVEEGFAPQQNYSKRTYATGEGGCDPEVADKVRAAAQHFRSLGAQVDDVSIPMHAQSAAIWVGFAMEAYFNAMLKGNGVGRNRAGLYVTSMNDAFAGWKQHSNEFPPGVKLGMLMGQYIDRHYSGHYYCKAMNLTRKLRAAYDDVLADYDILMMPTVFRKAQPLPPLDAPLEVLVASGFEGVDNVAAFDLSHHPAMSAPCGAIDGLPVGMMLIAKHFDEASIYRAAHAFEQSGDWQKM